MTNREFYNAVVASASASAEIKAFASEALAKLDATNEKRRSTLTKNQKANLVLATEILDGLNEGETTVASAVAVAHGISTQKASAILFSLALEGKVKTCEVKVKGKGAVKGYTKPEAITVAEGQ